MIINKAVKEAEIIRELTKLFSTVDSDSIVRILNWANAVYAFEKDDIGHQQLSIFDLPTFFSEKKPKTDKERALVVSYWFQYNEGNENIDALSVNKALYQINPDFKILNITRAYHLLQNHKPPLVIQTQKSSENKQGKKFYKLTQAGKKFVDEMK